MNTHAVRTTTGQLDGASSATSGNGATRQRSLALLFAAVVLLALPGVRLHGFENTLNQPQIWNCSFWQTVHLGDFYGPNYEIAKLKPISLVGVRGACHSGYIVMTDSNAPICELETKISDLVTKDGAKIPAASIKVRFPVLSTAKHGYTPGYRFNALLDAPSDEIEIIQVKPHRKWKPKRAAPVAMQPIWVTVRVPRDAKGGDYKGKLTVQTDNMKPFDVPVELRVHEWTLPDPKNFKMQNLAFYSPERVARYYGAEFWSEKHKELLAKSMQLMLEVGSRQLTLDLVRMYVARSNEESMVKWIKQPDGSFKYDFTAVEAYMDVAAKVVGKPFPIRLNMWNAVKKDKKPAQVSVLDPSTGKLSAMDQPPMGTPESLKFWKPVLDELRKRIEKRGWFDSVVVNWMNYCGPPDAKIVKVMHDIWPDGKWSSMDHGRRTRFSYGPNKFMPVPVSLAVWSEGTHKIYFKWDKKKSPGPRGFAGKFLPGHAICGHARNAHWDSSQLWILRRLSESYIMKGCYGVDPLGADLWLLRDRSGRWSGASWNRSLFRAYALGPQNCTMALLAPGENGAIATERYEAYREGVQISEAMVYIEQSLKTGKVDAKVAALANKALDDRARHFMSCYGPKDKKGKQGFSLKKFAEGAWALDDQLFAAAAAVEKALKK